MKIKITLEDMTNAPAPLAVAVNSEDNGTLDDSKYSKAFYAADTALMVMKLLGVQEHAQNLVSLITALYHSEFNEAGERIESVEVTNGTTDTVHRTRH